MIDNVVNLAYSQVANNPGTGGTSVNLLSTEGALFATSMNVTLCPPGSNPTWDNAEIVRVTGITGDTLTVTRAQEGTTAKDIQAGWQIFAGPTKSIFDQIKTDINSVGFTWKDEWTNATSYAVNDIVRVTAGARQFFYICESTHTSATATNKPGSGSSWETFWTLYSETPAVYVPRSITIQAPTATEDVTLMKFDRAVTIQKVHAVVKGSSTPNISFQLKHHTDRTNAGNTVFSSAQSITSTTTGSELTTFSDATVPADSFLWLITTAKSGTVDELHVTVEYTED